MEAQTNYDAYLTKRAKQRKIGMAIASLLAFLLAGVIIILSCVRVNNRPQFITAPDTVTITTTQVSTNIALNRNSNDESIVERYSQFMTTYNDMFKMSALSSLFSGSFGNYKINEFPLEDGAGNPKFSEFDFASPSELVRLMGKDYVEFSYQSPQQIKYKNGADYVCHSNTSWILTFDKAYFALSDESAAHDLVFYLAVIKTDPSQTTQNTRTRYIMSVSMKASTHSLYETVSEFK